jgi:histidine triad (HIT) family protein
VGAVVSDCLFCQIAAGTLAAPIVLDEPDVLAFLDHRPVFPGHCLVIPRSHHPTFTDLPPALLEPVFGAGQRVATAVEDAMAADGTFVAINNTVSQSVPHLHLHVVPRRRRDGLRGFFWPRQRYADDAEADAVAATIRQALAAATPR